MFLASWDGLQLHWASLLLSGGNKNLEAAGGLGCFASLKECGGGIQAEGTDFVL